MPKGRKKGSKNKPKEINLAMVDDTEQVEGQEVEEIDEDFYLHRVIELRKAGKLSRPKAVAEKCNECNGGEKTSCLNPACFLFEFYKFRFNIPKDMKPEAVEAFKEELRACGIHKFTLKVKGGSAIEEEEGEEAEEGEVKEEKPKKKRGVDWSKFTPQQRAAHIANMQAGRRAKKEARKKGITA